VLKAPDEAAAHLWRPLDDEGDRPYRLSAERETLSDAGEHEQQWRGGSNRPVVRQNTKMKVAAAIGLSRFSAEQLGVSGEVAMERCE
jgi:hypothetical protein